MLALHQKKQDREPGYRRGKSGLLSAGSKAAGFLEADVGVSKEPGAVPVF